MAAETGFDLDGTLYEVPTLDSLNMDEAQTLYDYCGLGIQDFVDDPDETDEQKQERERLFKNPALMRALMHIAYQRQHPASKPADVKKLLSGVNIVSALSKLSEGEVGEDGPPASTTEPERQSGSGSVEPRLSSGSGSSTGSTQEPAARLTAISTGS